MAGDKIVKVGDDDSIGERYVDLGDGTYVKPSATSPQVVILGKRKVGATARALPAPGWAWTAGIWTLDGVDVSGQTNPASYVRQAADVGKVLGFKPTSPIQVGYGGATELGVPDAPTGLVLTAIAGGVSAAFNTVPSANNGGSAITSYRVRLSDSSYNDGATSPIVVNTTSRDPVTAQVHAINAQGSGDRSTVSNAVTPIASGGGGSATIPVATIPRVIGVAAGYTTPDAVLSQQWTLDSVDVSGATSATYLQVIADSAKALRVRVTTAVGSATSLPVLPGVQNLKLSNTTKLRAMLAGGGGTILGMGDSSPAGFLSGGSGETNMRANSYLARLVAGLNTAGFPASKDSSFGGGQATTKSAYAIMDPRWTFSTNTPNLLAGFPTLGGLMFGMLHTDPTATAKFTPANSFDTADIYFGGNGASVASLGVYGTDGVTLVSTIDISTVTGVGVATVTFPSGTTSVTLKYLTGTGDPYVCGIKTRVAATPKIEVINGALTGAKVQENAVTPGTGSASATSYVPRAVAAKIAVGVANGVLVVNGWYNDNNPGGRTLAQIKADYDTICVEAKARGWDIIYCGYPALSSGNISQATFDSFEQPIMAYLRDTYDAVILQESKIITDYTTYNALGYYGDALHINGTGHQKIADTFVAICKLAAAGTLPA